VNTVDPSGAPTRAVWDGPQVLRSKTALALVCFWALLALVLLVPGPLRDRVRAGEEDRPTGRAPGLPAAPPAPAASEPAAGAGKRPGKAGLVGLPRVLGELELEAIQDPKGSMTHFYRALARTEKGEKGAFARVLHYGDSLIDLDFITAPVRRALQKRFGDAGHGFVLAAKPWRWYNHMDVSLTTSDGWEHFRLVGRRAGDGHLGLGCAAIQSQRSRAWTKISAREKASRVEVHFLRMPGGGTLLVEVDGKRRAELATAAGSKQPGFHLLELEDKPHEIRLEARGKVRLFGVVLERGERGVTWENLALVSARFNQFIQLDAEHWSAQLRHRAPDLVVFQFGANDSISFGGDLERYGRQVLRALELVRRAVPRSSCMVIGPLDRLQRDGQGRLRSPKVVRVVSGKQREVAIAAGCAFWDAQLAMGGPGSMQRWLRGNYVLKDLVHLNVRGSDVMGSILEQSLLLRLPKPLRGTPEGHTLGR